MAWPAARLRSVRGWRRTRGRRAFAGLLTVALAGPVAMAACLPLDPDPTVSLQWSELSEDAEALPVRAAGGRTLITVAGQIAASLPCDPLAGDLRTSGERFQLAITVRGGVNFCPGKATRLAYVARIVNVDPGVKELTVEHRFEGPTRPAEVVFEGTVEVR